jgi:hypothetical protein
MIFAEGKRFQSHSSGEHGSAFLHKSEQSGYAVRGQALVHSCRYLRSDGQDYRS